MKKIIDSVKIPSKRHLAVAFVGLCLQTLTASASFTWNPNPRSNTAIVASRTAMLQSSDGADFPCTAYPSDDAAIQAAINAVATAGGGSVLLTEGPYQIQNAISLASNVELRGEGEGVTVLQRDSAGIILVKVTGQNEKIADLSFDDENGSLLPGTAGEAPIQLLSASNVQISQVDIENIVAFGVEISASNNILINGCTLAGAQDSGASKIGGMGITSTGTSGPNTNINITNSIFRYNMRNGIYATAVDGLSVTNCTFLDNAYDPVVGGQIGLSTGCIHVTIEGCTMTEDGANPYLATGQYTVVSEGVQLDVIPKINSSAAPSRYVTIAGNAISREGYAGISLYVNTAGSTTDSYCTIKNNTIGDTNMESQTDTGAILIHPGVTDFVIEGNALYANDPKSLQKRGIYIMKGNSDRYVIASNLLNTSSVLTTPVLIEDDAQGAAGTGLTIDRQVYGNSPGELSNNSCKLLGAYLPANFNFGVTTYASIYGGQFQSSEASVQTTLNFNLTAQYLTATIANNSLNAVTTLTLRAAGAPVATLTIPAHGTGPFTIGPLDATMFAGEALDYQVSSPSSTSGQMTGITFGTQYQ